MLQRFRRRAQGDRGAVAVEAALVTPLILLIVFGIIEFTLLLKDDVAVTSAVRAGSRTASAEPRVPTFLDDTARSMSRTVQTLDKDGLEDGYGQLFIYESDKDGFPLGSPTTFACGTHCVRYSWDATAAKFVKRSGSWDYRTINACAGDPNLTVVGVRLEYRHTFLTGVFGGGRTLSDESVQNFEPIATVDDPDGVCK
jgi:TadE-like protein